MTIIRAIAFLLFFTLVPISMGRLITYKADAKLHSSPIVIYVVGLFSSWGVFYLICAVLSYLQLFPIEETMVAGAYTKLVVIYSIVIAAFFIYWVFVDRAYIKGFFTRIKEKKDNLKFEFKADKFLLVYTLIFVGLLLVQMYFAYGYEVNQWSYDDYDYVTNSLDNIDSDTISGVNHLNGYIGYCSPKRMAVSWTAYVSYLSSVSGFSPANICHTILPVLMLVIAYGIYYYMASFIFVKYDNRMIFLCLLSVLLIFGMYSHYSLTFRLLCTLWQGKSIVASLAIPFLICYLPRVYETDYSRGNLLPIIAVSLGSCSLASTAAMMVGGTAAALWLIMVIYKKKIYGIKYLIASLSGPAFLGAFYVAILYVYNIKRALETIH